MITIVNEHLKVTINPIGAELISLVAVETNTEYMWGADPKFWGKSSPVLFPIVGGLKNDTYFFDGKEYHLPRHGFARTMHFEVESKTVDSAMFLLKNSAESEQVFPFKFELRLRYTLHKNTMALSYQITNPDEKKLWFSIGGHPAFKCPIIEKLTFNDYYLEFNQSEDFQRWPLNEVGLLLDSPFVQELNTNKIALSKELFYEDALVFKHLKSQEIIMKSEKDTKELKFEFENFPYLGIWSAKNADFICIEPWCGIADTANTNQNLTEKEGIIGLNPKETFERTFKISV